MYKTFITPEQLKGLMKGNPPPIIFDTRFALSDTEYGRSSYRSGHIPGAIYAHLDEDLSGPIEPGITGRHPLPPPRQFANKLENWGVSNSSQVVVYDDTNGGIAARMWWMLRWLGHDSAAVLDGGWRAWQSSGGTTATMEPAPAKTKFQVNLRSEMAIDGRRVMAMRKNERKRLFDSRTADRFAGQNETIDPIPGHIPGASLASFQDTSNPAGLSLSPETLRAWLKEKLQDTAPENAIFYCGSGVTACRNVLAMEHAGLHGSKIYPGSWSEWILISSEVATE